MLRDVPNVECYLPDNVMPHPGLEGWLNTFCDMSHEKGCVQVDISADLIRCLPELFALLVILSCQRQAPCPYCIAADTMLSYNPPEVRVMVMSRWVRVMVVMRGYQQQCRSQMSRNTWRVKVR